MRRKGENDELDFETPLLKLDTTATLLFAGVAVVRVAGRVERPVRHGLGGSATQVEGKRRSVGDVEGEKGTGRTYAAPRMERVEMKTKL
jgi:hypothetical protein